MSHMAKLRSETNQSVLPIVTSTVRSGLKAAPWHDFLFFLPAPGRCTHFSLAFTSRTGATPLLGRRLSAGRIFASPFKKVPEAWLFWRLRVRFGRPLASAGSLGGAPFELPGPSRQLHNA